MLKNCLIYFPLCFEYEKVLLNINKMEQYIIPGNTTMNDLRLMIGNKYKYPPKGISITITDEYLNKIKANENCEDKYLFKKKYLDENYNNITLNQILQLKEKLFLEIKPRDKIVFHKGKNLIPKEPLLIKGELNSKFENIIKSWYQEFTEGNKEKRMTIKEVVKFVQKFSFDILIATENDKRVISFMKENDKGQKGYITEQEFIDFYKRALLSGNENVVLENLMILGYNENLRKESLKFKEKERLPRFKLGNDLVFIKNLIKK